MDKFFIFIGVMVVVNTIGLAPPFIISAINDDDNIDEAILGWHIVMTMLIAVFISVFVVDPSLFNLMWID